MLKSMANPKNRNKLYNFQISKKEWNKGKSGLIKKKAKCLKNKQRNVEKEKVES